LSKTLSVIARNTAVVVLYKDGSETIWGEEPAPEQAQRLSKELEIELRAINYVKWHVRTFIQEMKGLLKSYARATCIICIFYTQISFHLFVIILLVHNPVT
jgi:hypothetical protein